MADHPEGYGIYFQDRWNEALAADPRFIYINDWNEWTAGKYHPTDTGLSIAIPPEDDRRTVKFMRRDSNYMFVDQYNAEFNRCIQPMKDGYSDNYYMQMAQNIRRYKGVRPIPKLSGMSPIVVDGDFADWDGVSVEYRDTLGDTLHRDFDGYRGLHYTDTSGRNDIVTCKVAVAGDDVCFYAETREPLTAPADDKWMLLLIDADRDHSTGWYGYDLLVNRERGKGTASVMGYDKGQWLMKRQVPMAWQGKCLELAVPLDLMKLDSGSFVFDFKWADNPGELDDPIALCTEGDTAPNRRFNYRCIWAR